MRENPSNEKQTIELAKRFGLTEQETNKFIKKLNRTPTMEELAVCGALWSEHCSYKSSKIHLKKFHTDEPWVLQGPGENAGVVAVTQDYGIAFKMESHNHPSYIEPYQGAATGVGGILRDVFCMGAYPIANLNCLRFGEGSWNGVLLRDTVRGIGDYGNSVGVPTITGDVSFHYNYSKNILVNAFTAGLIHKNKIYKGILSEKEVTKNNISNIKVNTKLTKEIEKELFPKSENILIYFGSATGRDGVHGATMSSSEFSGNEQTLKPTVQVGDPFTEKVLLEATLSLIEKKLTVGLQDMGAAGLTSSSVEMAGRSKCGVAIDLNKVPQRASNMQAFEILLSESQERMLCAVKPENKDALLMELKKFDLSYAEIGKVNSTGLFVCLFDDEVVTATPIELLVEDIPRFDLPIQSEKDYFKNHKTLENKSKELIQKNKLDKNKPSLSLKLANKNAFEDILNNISLENFIEKYPNLLADLFAHPMYASRAPIYHNYCSTVQGNTVAGSGALQNAAAGVVRLPKYAQEISKDGTFSNIGVAIAGGCEERLVELDPFNGAALSTLKVARKLIATGAIPLGMTDCLNFGSPKSEEVMFQLTRSIDGINEVAKVLHIPIVSGNVSLNNQTDGRPIAPTPMLAMVGRVDDITKVPLAALNENDFEHIKSYHLVHLETLNSLADSSFEASQTAWILGESNSNCPKINLKAEKTLWQCVHNSILDFNPKLCVPVGHGGVLGCVIKISLESQAELNLSENIWNENIKNLFAEGNKGFIFGFSSKENANIFIKKYNNIFNTKYLGFISKQSQSVKKLLFNFNSTNFNYKNSLQKFFDTLSCNEKDI